MQAARDASETSTPGRRGTMAGSIADGWQRVGRAPTLVAGVLLTSIAFTVLMASVSTLPVGMLWPLGASAESEPALAAPDTPTPEARLIARALLPNLVGLGGPPSSFAEPWGPLPYRSAMVSMFLADVVLWMFLSGGVLDRLARDRPIRTSAFFAACGEYVARFLRLMIPIGLLYWLAWSALPSLLFDRLAAPSQFGLGSDASGLIRAGFSVVCLVALVAVSLLADLAKVRLVVEDRRSALGGIAAGWRFLRRHPIQTLAIHLIYIFIMVIVASLAWWAAPVESAAAWQRDAALTVSLMARVLVKLAWVASLIAWFQHSLAHAGYTAAPPARWPESASAEAIRNLTLRD